MFKTRLKGMEDGIALLQHAAPTGEEAFDKNAPWETAWAPREEGTAVRAPLKKNLSVRYASGRSLQSRADSPLSSEDASVRRDDKENAHLTLGRSATVEIDLLIQAGGWYLFAFELLPPQPGALDAINCCLPSTFYVDIEVRLENIDLMDGSQWMPLGATLGSYTAKSLQRGSLTTQSKRGLVSQSTFRLRLDSKNGSFNFDLPNNSEQYRLSAILRTSPLSFKTKFVALRLDRRPASDPHVLANNLPAEIRRNHSAVFYRDGGFKEETPQETRDHPFLNGEAFRKFTTFFRNSLTLGSTFLKRAGLETANDTKYVREMLAALETPHEGALKKNQMVPLRTRGTGFFEDLGALKEFYAREQSVPADQNPEDYGEEQKHVEETQAPIYGRSVMLRAVNLSGNTKMPIGCATELPLDMAKVRDPNYCRDEITFVGRPFPLEEADEHLSRIARWGFNCLRLIVTWEAIEHAGPGELDETYLEYIEAVIQKAGQYDLYVFIDPHQDVWSRFTGGSGSPAWTLELCGLNVETLQASLASFTHHASSPNDPSQFRKMTWPQNYQRFAVMHMFTLFFGGKTFAPDFFVDSEWKPGGVNGPSPEVSADHPRAVHVQDFLQSHFINCMRAIAVRVAKFPHVLGFDSFNEPSAGLIGKPLDKYHERIIPNGYALKPIEAMACSSGIPTTIRIANAIGLLTSSEVVNQSGVSAFIPGRTDCWRAHGVWRNVSSTHANGLDGYELLKPLHFVQRPDGSGAYSFFRDFLRPFGERYIAAMREVRSNFILFLEGDAFGHKDFFWDKNKRENVVNATHWYDGFTLFMRRYSPSVTIDVNTNWPVMGRKNVRAMHMKELRSIMKTPKDSTNPMEDCALPTLIGEFGCPFDLNDKIGLKTGDFSSHTEALASYYSMFDELEISSALWTYCAENSNVYGDHWNLENLSIFSTEQQTNKSDPDSGARALAGFCRPWAPIVAGKRRVSKFDEATRTYTLRYLPSRDNFECGDPLTCSVVYLPDVHFLDTAKGLGAQPTPMQLDLEVINGTYVLVHTAGRHLLYVWATSDTKLGVIEPVEVRVKGRRN